MAEITPIQFYRGPAADWTAANPTLAAGKPGFETDTGKLKIGDGTTAWNSLGYQATEAAALLKAGGTMSGPLAMGTNKITGLGAATANGDAVRYEQVVAIPATALVDGATIDLTAAKHTLASSSATRTFTISYTGDDITLEVTLSNTSATYTFPAAALCVSEGVASGNNTLALAGVSGDKYIISIKKMGSAYYVVSKNFGQ